MNSPSNAIPDSADSSVATPAIMLATRPMYWSIRRELWENRFIYIAPLAIAGVFLFAFLISLFTLPHRMRATLPLDPAHQMAQSANAVKPSMMESSPYSLVALLIMGAAFVVGIFYCIDALHGERRDRSILFWKSLPVSDLTTVLSKASIPMVVLPLLSFAITIAVQWIMLLLSSAVLLVSGQSVAAQWAELPLFQMSVALLYHLLVVHSLWYAPMYCWMLLVSGWARRAAFLWATLPLAAVCVIEKIAFNTTHFAGILGDRFGGSRAGDDFTEGMASMHPMAHITPGNFFTSAGLWIGLAVAAVFLAAAVRMRRYQGPI